ncbi:MAG: hypothetical protein ACTSPL_08105, partial [Candidatus Odinarchaeia archaeon]
PEENQLQFPSGPPEIGNFWGTLDDVEGLTAATWDHFAIHFIPKGEKTFYACFDRYVEFVNYNHTTGYDDKISNGFYVRIMYNDEYHADYRFEFFNPDGYLSEDYIKSKVYVSKGQWVKKGDPIGTLVKLSEDTHLCFDVWQYIDGVRNETFCMFPLFEPGLAKQLDDFYVAHKSPGAQDHICPCWEEHNIP